MHFKQGDDIAHIPVGMRQVFENKFTVNIGQKEIIKMKNGGAITDRDIAIAKFFFKFKFANLEQIYKYLSFTIEPDKEMPTIAIIKNRLDKLVKYRILNKFMITRDPMVDSIQPDSMHIYCLDLGGRYLLAHYSTEDTVDWYSTVNMKASELISKDLFVVDFYLSLLSTCPEKVLYFNVEPDIRIAKKNVMPSFDFCLDNGGNKNYYIGEVVRDIEFPLVFRDRAYKYEDLLESNGWKKYYYDAPTPPVLFVFADSDFIALEVSKLLTETTGIKRFRVSTDERTRRPLYELGAFLKYLPETQELQEIKAITFAPNN